MKMEMTRAERETLAQAADRVVEQVFSEFPELRLFPEMVGDVAVHMHTLYSAGGMGDVQIVEMLGSPQGTIAIAGTVYGLMNGRTVGADAGAIEHGML